MLRRVLAASVLLLFVPIAAGQPPSGDPPAELTLKEDTSLPNGRLFPETGQAVVRIAFEVGCALPPAIEDSVATFDVESTAPYATAVVLPPSVSFKIPAEKCAESTYRETLTAEVFVVTTRHAPALESFVTTVSATIQSEGHVYGPFTADFAIINDFAPLSMINPIQLFAKVEPGQPVSFPVEVQNLGNGPTLVTFEVMQPNKNKLPLIETGPSLHLESRATGGAHAAFKTMHYVRAETPPADGYTNSIYQFNVKYASEYDGNASGMLATDEQTIAFAVQVQGGALGGFAPSPGIALILAGVVALTLALRRRP